jgi:hypothetical protein
MALPSDEGARGGAGPDFEGTREHGSLSIAYGVGNGSYGSGAVLNQRFGEGAALVADQAAEAGTLLSEAPLKGAGREAELLGYGG